MNAYKNMNAPRTKLGPRQGGYQGGPKADQGDARLLLKKRHSILSIMTPAPTSPTSRCKRFPPPGLRILESPRCGHRGPAGPREICIFARTLQLIQLFRVNARARTPSPESGAESGHVHAANAKPHLAQRIEPHNLVRECSQMGVPRAPLDPASQVGISSKTAAEQT